MSSMRTPGKSFFWMLLRSEPLPLTRSTRTSRPRWSRSMRLIDVLPPPHTTSEVSAPMRRDAYTSRSRSDRPSARASSQREFMAIRYPKARAAVNPAAPSLTAANRASIVGAEHRPERWDIPGRRAHDEGPDHGLPAHADAALRAGAPVVPQ